MYNVEKYMKRPDSAEDLTLPEFFTQYRPLYNSHASNVQFSSNSVRWTKRKTPCLWRTRFLVPSSGEAFYFQRVLINVPFRELDDVFDLENNVTYKGQYSPHIYEYKLVRANTICFVACHDDLVYQECLPPLAHYSDTEAVQHAFAVAVEDGEGVNLSIGANATHESVQSKIDAFTPSQYRSYCNALELVDAGHPVLIHGGAGTGKSFCLGTLNDHFSLVGYKVK